MSLERFTWNFKIICDTKGGSFDTIPSRFVSPKSSTILDLEKSLLCKVCSLTRVLFDSKPYNFTWEVNLKKKWMEKQVPLGMYELSTSWLQASLVLPS